MSNAWFRMYSEFAHDPKVQMLSEVMQRRYIMLMCMRCSNALVTLHDAEVAFHLRISETDMAETKALFIAKGFIDDAFNLLNWEKRQFASTDSSSRVAKHRAIQKEKQNKQSNACNTDVTLHVTTVNALDTDTDTDTDTEQSVCVTSPNLPETELPAEVFPTAPSTPTMAGAVCVALKSVGMARVNPGHLALRELIDAGAELGSFVEAGRTAVGRGKGFEYVLGMVRNQLAESQYLASIATARASAGPSGILPGAI